MTSLSSGLEVSGHEVHEPNESFRGFALAMDWISFIRRRGRGIGGEGNGDEEQGRGRNVEEEIYTDYPTISCGISQASGTGIPVEGQGESSGGQDGGSRAGIQVEGGEGDRNGDIGGQDGGIRAGIQVEGGEGDRNGERNGDIGGQEVRVSVGDVNLGTTLAKIFIALAAQSSAAAVAVDILGLSSMARVLLVFVLVSNLVGFVCCYAALLQSHTSPRASGILARMGSAAISLGFILIIAMILPRSLLWMIVLACLALLAVSILSCVC